MTRHGHALISLPLPAEPGNTDTLQKFYFTITHVSPANFLSSPWSYIMAVIFLRVLSVSSYESTARLVGKRKTNTKVKNTSYPSEAVKAEHAVPAHVVVRIGTQTSLISVSAHDGPGLTAVCIRSPPSITYGTGFRLLLVPLVLYHVLSWELTPPS